MTSPRLRNQLGPHLEQRPEPLPILYVEDEPEDATALQWQLGSSVDNPVICFTSGEELYTYLDETPGQCILLIDLVLFNVPGYGGGYEVITTLKARGDLADTRSPIIAVTGTVLNEAIIRQTRQIGAVGVVPKPVQVRHLVDILGPPGWFRVGLSR